MSQNLNLKLELIFGLLLLVVQLSQCGPCTLPNGKSSQCERIHLCNDIWNYVKANGNTRNTQNYVKGYQTCPEGQNFVCCPNLASGAPALYTVTTPPVAATTLPSRPTQQERGATIPLKNNVDALPRHPNFQLINNAGCGIKTKERVLNGNLTEPMEYPWNALLGYKDPFETEISWKCGGTLISERYVLTAAHCFLRSIKLVVVRLGEHDIKKDPDCDDIDDCADPVQDIPVESQVAHESYSRTQFANDIAIVRLARPANLKTNNVRTICLPTTKQLFDNKPAKLIITGWGNTEFGTRSDILLQALVPYVPNNVCQRRFDEGNKRVNVFSSIMCAGGTTDNVDTCHGDSGGPITWPGPCTLPDGRSSECERIHRCNDIINFIKANKNAQSVVQNHVNKFQTCLEGRSYVCCPNLASSDTIAPPTPTPPPVGNEDHIPSKPDAQTLSRHPNSYLLNNPACGVKTKKRIINGNQTEIEEYPWNALLGFKEPYEDEIKFRCGGTLISERYVLTAAHCILNSLKLIRLGEHNLSTDPDCEYDDDDELVCASSVQDIPVETAIAHEYYSRQKLVNDIAMVRLARPANIRVNNVKTICLPMTPAALNNLPKKLIVTGWGNTETRRKSEVLLQALVPHVSNDECQRRFTEGKKRIQINDAHLCAGGTTDNVDACKGDSGGPIQAVGKVSDGSSRFIQYGVVSAGINCNILETRNFYPGLYTDVSWYMQWILDAMKP